MPSYQPSLCLEPPSFVVPQTHMHLMDYRQMLNPLHYQTMAYRARRFHYQHNHSPSSARETTSCQVQTEPLPGPQGPGASSASGPLEAPSGPPACVPEEETSTSTPGSSTSSRAPNGSFVIQTEEVRIQCNTPAGLHLLQEAAEVSTSFSQDLVVHSSSSSSVLHGLPAEQAEQVELQVCPDILLVGSSGEKIPALEESGNQTEITAPDSCSAAAEDQSEAQENFHFKDVQKPFDPKYLDELKKMESTVWSEETLIPSPGAADLLVSPKMFETPSAEHQHEVLVSESPGDEPPKAGTCSTVEAPAVEESPPSRAELQLLDVSSPKGDRFLNVQQHQDTSFESLPAYLPSSRCLSDFDGVHYWGRFPAAPRKKSRPRSSQGHLEVPSRRRKLDLDFVDHQGGARKPKERYRPRGGRPSRQSFSDHECCLSRSYNENFDARYASKRERLCSRCLAKEASRRRAVPLQQRNEAAAPQTCEACRSHTIKQARKGSAPNVWGRLAGRDTEGESSENSPGRARWRQLGKKPLAPKQNLEKLPGTHPKLREKNCACSETCCQPVARDRTPHCPHGNAIREADESGGVPFFLQDKWRKVDQTYLLHKWQTGTVCFNSLIKYSDLF